MAVTTGGSKKTPSAARAGARSPSASHPPAQATRAKKNAARKAPKDNRGASTSKPAATRKRAASNGESSQIRLLSGGNPQIPKGDGDAPVQAYIRAMPGWKREVGRQLDALIERTVPGVTKAVRWNSPFYGVEGQGWFIAYHCYNRYVKLTFFRGQSLKPMPPGQSKDPSVRYLDIHEHDEVGGEQLADWIRQAAALPGWKP